MSSVSTRLGSRLSVIGWPGTLRPYQVKALDALAAGWAAGRQRAWVVLPPGAGKTLVGLEAARRLGRRTVVLTPNTAIQGQWLDHWSRFEPATVEPGSDRSLDADVTVLTYQSLAVFDPEAEIHDNGHIRGSSLMRRLHEGGRALVDALRAAGPLTLVLDECHHLLEVWGQLVAEVLEQLPGTRVIGLTATPPQSLTAEETQLVNTLFGVPILGASIPALVRQGHLAPFAELVWLTTPTAVESGYIASEAQRFAELTTDLTAPDLGFLTWIDARFVAGGDRTPVSWEELERREPTLAAAVLRFHFAGMVGLPPGARLREEHRHGLGVEDWLALLGDFVQHRLVPSDAPRDVEALEAIRRALPSVGFRLTRRGIRAAESPVDRVLARSAAKAYAAVEIAAAEAAAGGDRLRCLVLCDHERTGARLPARLRDVLDPESGSAWLMLQTITADPRTRSLAPMLVTGRTVAAGEETAQDFTARHTGLTWEKRDGLAVISGSWSTRTWVSLVTADFEAGNTQLLIGTRALLGEGWDARHLNALIDVTTATTPASVVQTRGRAIRVEPTWPEKTANTWTVVTTTEQHPKGAADWHRFVRKHEGYLAATPEGEIVSGVAHVDAEFSPYAPPPVADIDRINARMMERAADRDSVRVSWRLGTPFRDELVHTIRVRSSSLVRPMTRPASRGRPIPPVAVPVRDGIQPRPGGSVPSRVAAVSWAIVAAGLWLIFAWRPKAGEAALAVLATLAAAALAGRAAARVRRAALAVDAAAGEPSLLRFAYAVADALAALERRADERAGRAGGARSGSAPTRNDVVRGASEEVSATVDTELSVRGAESVEMHVEPDGSYSFALAAVDTAASERFALALDEILSPIASPRYVMPRYILRSTPGRRVRLARGRDLLKGSLEADGVVYHAVPAVFGGSQKRVAAFAQAWNRWISGGDPVRTTTPEGEGILVTHRGEDPFAATTVLRVAWS